MYFDLTDNILRKNTRIKAYLKMIPKSHAQLDMHDHHAMPAVHFPLDNKDFYCRN